MKKEEVIKRIGKENWKDFLVFMTRQTIGINKDGSYDYYKHDVEKFEHILNRPISFKEFCIKHMGMSEEYYEELKCQRK